jgi:SAM-dependent methyltransferase
MFTFVRKIKGKFPWYIKFYSKYIFSKMNIPYSFLKKIGLCEHGDTENVDALLKKVEGFNQILKFSNKKEFTYLELGPGDSIGGAAALYKMGARSIYFCDVGDFSEKNLDHYRDILEKLDFKKQITSRNDFLEMFNVKYFTKGLEDLKKIPNDSVDIIVSCAVLEHVSKKEFRETFKELYRILKKDGVSYHIVDLKDHLGGNLNNLRFSEKFWQSDWMINSGFYTNRIRFNEMCKLFDECGFVTNIISTNFFNEIVPDLKKMDKQFQVCEKEDLLVSGFSCLLTK